MKRILLFLLLLPVVLARGQNMDVYSGSYIKCLNGSHLVVNNTNLNVYTTNATFNGVLRFSGNSLRSLGGPNTALTLRSLYVDKGTGYFSTFRDLTVLDTVRFVSGRLNYGSKTIELNNTGVFWNEREASHAFGSGTGSIRCNRTLFAPYFASPGNLGLVISSAANLGNTLIIRRPNPYNPAGPNSGIQRTYQMSVQNNVGLDAYVEFDYFNAERNGVPEAGYTLFSSPDGINWTDIGYGVRDTVNNYLYRFGINSLNWLTVGSITPCPSASITANPVGQVCENAPVTLTASLPNAVSYLWSNGGTNASTVVNPYFNNNTYTVTVVETGGCTATASYTVPFNFAPPSYTFPTGVVNTCPTLIQGPACFQCTYQWFLNGSPIAGATQVNYTVTNAGTYTLRTTSNIGCTAMSPAITALCGACPTVTIAAGPAPQCPGGTTTLTASGAAVGAVYAWSNGIFGASTVVAAGTYTVTATGGGCTVTASYTVTQQPDLTPPSIVCPGQQNLSSPNPTVSLPSYIQLATASDNCLAPSITQSPVAGTVFNSNQLVTVTMTATDANGNTATCSFAVAVQVNNSCPGVANVIYVKNTATGGNNGTTWDNAYTDLQTALAAATAGSSIWVAQGTYKPSYVADRAATFALRPNVSMYGGFANAGCPVFNDRNPALYPTVLSGDVGYPGIHNDNSLTILTLNNNQSSTIDGFDIRDAYDDVGSGGAMAITATTAATVLNISGCHIRNNYALSNGAGVSSTVRGRPLQASFVNCFFENNHADGSGGAFYLSTTLNSTVNINFDNCQLDSNAAQVRGGAMSLNFAGTTAGAFQLSGCSVNHNQAPNGNGGAIYAYARQGSGMQGTMSNCQFGGNMAMNSPVVHFYQSAGQGQLDMEDCIVSGSVSSGYGPVTIYAERAANVVSNVERCEINQNTSVNGGAFSVNALSGAAVAQDILRCRFNGNTGTNGGAGRISATGSGSSSEVNMVNCLLTNNAATGNGGALNISMRTGGSGSTNLTNCTVAENLANTRGSAIYNYASGAAPTQSAVALVNTILRTPGTVPLFYNYGVAPFQLTNCIVQQAVCNANNNGPAAINCAATLAADPLFVNPAGGDFHVQGGSPAIDAGTAVGAPNVDYDGSARPAGGVHDMGAFEYTGARPARRNGAAVSDLGTRLFPNPTPGGISIEFGEPFRNADQVLLEVLDMSGRVLGTRSFIKPSLEYYELPAASGALLVRITSKEASEVWRVAISGF